jgi:hypothetical protein
MLVYAIDQCFDVAGPRIGWCQQEGKKMVLVCMLVVVVIICLSKGVYIKIEYTYQSLLPYSYYDFYADLPVDVCTNMKHQKQKHSCMLITFSTNRTRLPTAISTSILRYKFVQK